MKQRIFLPLFYSGLRNSFTQFLTLLLLAVAFLVTGCKKETELSPATAGSLLANAGTDQQIQVGQVVTLDGSASADGQGKPFSFAWAVARKPAKSTIVLAGANTSKPTFTPDEVGDYEFELTISNANRKSTDKVLVTASVAEPLAITQDISVKTLLVDRVANPELPDYIVTRTIGVKSELTINPGVVIAFERDTRLDINDNGGVIIARGEPNKRIGFVGVQKTKGFWNGIMLYSGSNANEFDYVDVMHTGSRTLYSDKKAAMVVFGASHGQLAIKNSTFSQNDGYGLYLLDGSILREFARNTFTNHTEAGIWLTAPNVVKLDAASVFTGQNGRNVVELGASTVKSANDDEVVWAGFADKTPYRVMGELSVEAGWKLAPGVTVEMGRDQSIQINQKGYLIARGTTTDKVTITGASRTPGYWRGMICYSTNAQNLIENAEVSNAGSNALVSNKKTNIALWGAKATMTIRNSRISGSGSMGVYVSYGSTINADVTTVNTFEGNPVGNVVIDK